MISCLHGLQRSHSRASAVNFSGGRGIRIEAVLTTKNGRIFEIREVYMKVCENPAGQGRI